MSPGSDATRERPHDRHDDHGAVHEIADVDRLKQTLQLEARLLAYEVAITRSARVIPHSLDEFIGRDAR